MADVARDLKEPGNLKASANGLEPGYAEDKWGPWKSHKLLLSEAISSIPDWSSRAGVLARTFNAFSKVRAGFLTEKEFSEILNAFPCCEEIFYHHFYQLFDRDQDGFLTEVDFISGMLAVSPVTDHDITKPSGLLRLQLIFLYYDANRNGRLDVEELSLMIEHLEQLRSSMETEKGPKLEMRQLAVSDAKSLMALYKGGFWYRCLYDAAAKGMLNGMDQLLRTSGDLSASILRVNPQLAVGAAKIPPRGAAQVEPVKNIFSQAPPPQLPPQQYFSNGAAPPINDFSPPGVSTITPVAGNHNTSSMYGGVTPGGPSSGLFLFNPVLPQQRPQYVPELLPTGTKQSVGSHVGNMMVGNTPKSTGPMPLPLRVIRGLEEFVNQQSGTMGLSPFSWKTLNLCTYSELIQICESVLPILCAEDSLVHTPFPARIYGDIHGNLPDLTQFFNKYAWPDKRKGDILCMNYVFLGDYVDRGNFSIETIALLFSLKIVYPSKVVLLRGNHEDRSMNYHFGLRKDCVTKFGTAEGNAVWEKINECFDHLPLACLVGEEVLCIHGGIGNSIEYVNDLAGISKPITVPPESVDPGILTKVDRVVLDALWSDPVEAAGGSMNQKEPITQREAFLASSRFGPERIKSFVSNNNLQFIVRGHQCVKNGYEYFAEGLLLTIFSATNYCGQHANDAGMVVVVKNSDGSLEEHAQIIKPSTNPADAKIAWDETQSNNHVSPMRSIYKSIQNLQKIDLPRPSNNFIQMGNPASPIASKRPM